MVRRRDGGHAPGGSERGDGRARVQPGRVSDPAGLLGGDGVGDGGGADGGLGVLRDVDDRSAGVVEVDLVSNEVNLAA